MHKYFFFLKAASTEIAIVFVFKKKIHNGVGLQRPRPNCNK